MKILLIIAVSALFALTRTYADEAEDHGTYEDAMRSGHEMNGKGDADGAQNLFESALQLAPDESAAARARNQIAAILKNKKIFDEARQLLQTSLTTKGVDAGAKAEAQYLLAHSWIDAGDWTEAHKAWARLLDMEGLWPYALSEARMIVGRGLVEQKKYAEARKILGECVAATDGVDWHKSEAQLSIATSYQAEGKQAEAKAAIETLLGMKGLNEGRKQQASELLKKLE